MSVEGKTLMTTYELIDEGIDHSQYWQGRGTGHYNHVIVGYGDDASMAIEDLLEQLAMQDVEPSTDLTEELDAAKAEPSATVSCHDDCFNTWHNEQPEEKADEYMALIKTAVALFSELKLTNHQWYWEASKAVSEYDDDHIEKYDEWHEECEMAYRVSVQYDIEGDTSNKGVVKLARNGCQPL